MVLRWAGGHHIFCGDKALKAHAPVGVCVAHPGGLSVVALGYTWFRPLASTAFFVFWLFLFLWLAVPWLSEQRTWHLSHVRPLLARVTLSTRSSWPFSLFSARSLDDPLLRLPSSILGVVSVFAPVEHPLTFLRLFVLHWGLDSTFPHP